MKSAPCVCLFFCLTAYSCEAPISLSTDLHCEAGLVCGASSTRRCIDPRSDPANCGACDHPCSDGGVCTHGACCIGLSCLGRCLGTSFEDTRTAPTGRETVGIYLHDLDLDGFDDLVAANQLDGTITVYWGNPQGQLSLPSLWRVGRLSGSLAFGDLDSDGLTDIVICLQTWIINAFRITQLGVLSVLANRTLASERGVRIRETGEPKDLVLFDADRDGALDLALRREDTGCVLIRKGDGRGGLAQGSCIYTVATGPDQGARIVPIDTNRDGRSELLVVQPAGAALLHLTPDGSLARADTNVLPAVWLQTLNNTHTVDIDRDGWPELAVVRHTIGDNGFRIDLLSAANGHIATYGCSLTGSSLFGVTGIGDFNGDGLPDIYSVTTCIGCPYTASLSLRQ